MPGVFPPGHPKCLNINYLYYITLHYIIPPVQVAEGQGDRTPVSIDASWNGMQQQHASCSWTLTCIVVVPMCKLHVVAASRSNLRRWISSASLLSLYRGNGVKAFETAATDNGGRKMAISGVLADRILHNLLVRRWSAHLCLVWEPPCLGKLSEKLITT